MVSDAELGEGLNSPQLIDLSKRAHEKSKLPSEVRIKGSQIGIDKWQEMLKGMSEDGNERGLTVSKDLFGRIQCSPILAGGENRVQIPDFPMFNIKISQIHTHPIENPLIPTTMPLNNDCYKFAEYNFACQAIVDNGGVHVLLKERRIPLETSPFPEDSADQAIIKAAGKSGLTLDAMKNLANSLERYGIRYYFSPSHTTDPDGTIALKDVRQYKIISKSEVV